MLSSDSSIIEVLEENKTHVMGEFVNHSTRKWSSYFFLLKEDENTKIKYVLTFQVSNFKCFSVK